MSVRVHFIVVFVDRESSNIHIACYYILFLTGGFLMLVH